MKNTFKPLPSLIVSVMPLLLISTAHAADGIWTLDGSGLWSSPGNWSGGVAADGSGATANFGTINITADRIVSLDYARSIGNLVFGDTVISSAAGWTLDNNGNSNNVLTLAGNTHTVMVNSLGNGKPATITTSIAGTDGLNKSGTGTLVLAGSNTFTGNVGVNTGTLSLGSLSALGATSGISLANGTTLAANVEDISIGAPITLSGNATVNLAVAGPGTKVLNFGVITGTGNLTLQNSVGFNPLSVFVVNAAGNYLGDTTLTAINTNSSVVLKLGIANALPTTTALNLDGGNGAGSGRWADLELNGFNQTLAGLSNVTRTLRVQRVRNTSASPATLTINDNTNRTFSGRLGDAGTNFGITKGGSGTYTLSGTNTYTGATTVNAGTLLVNSPGSLSALSAVTVNGGTLGGSGTIGGSVTMAAEGSLSPGTAASTGTLSIGGNLDVSALANASTGKLQFEIATPATSDKIAVTGTLTIGSGTLGLSDFVFSDIGSMETGIYTLITTPAGITGTLDPNDLGGMIGSLSGILRINGNNIELLYGDSDGDGLRDSYELAHTSPPSATALHPGDDLENGGAGDGLSNLQEYQHGTNPNNPDTDADGITDGTEVNYVGSFFKFVPGALSYPQAAADATIRHGRVASFTNAFDYTRMAAKARQVTQGYVWIGLSDAATEGTWRWTDGSTATYNRWLAGQPSGGLAENQVVIMENSTLWADANESYVAAGYLFERAGLDPLTPDTDGDGLTDRQEINTVRTNPFLDDTDNDGLLDGAEVNTHSTNPLLADTDEDGINDRNEVVVYLTNPALKDTDDDGFEDLFEINAGFNPTLNTSTPDALITTLTAVELRSYALNGVSYRIESSTDLNEWTTVETDIIGTGALITRFYSIETQPKRYFRVKKN